MASEMNSQEVKYLGKGRAYNVWYVILSFGMWVTVMRMLDNEK